MRRNLGILWLAVLIDFIPAEVAAQTEGMSRWDPPDLLTEGRQEHTATLLASRRVLVAGGRREELNRVVSFARRGPYRPPARIQAPNDLLGSQITLSYSKRSAYIEPSFEAQAGST